MKDEKRAPRSYKAKQTPYVKACKRAKKEQTTLAEMIEVWVTAYGDGCFILPIEDSEKNYSKSKK